jgi:hypothetical protein
MANVVIRIRDIVTNVISINLTRKMLLEHLSLDQTLSESDVVKPNALKPNALKRMF